MTAADVAAPVANVCTGRETSVLQLAHTLRDLTGYTGTISHGPARAGDIRISVGDPKFAIERLNRCAKVSLADGLSKLLAAQAG